MGAAAAAPPTSSAAATAAAAPQAEAAEASASRAAASEPAAEAQGAAPRNTKKAKVAVLPPSVNDAASRMVGGLTPRMRYALVAASDAASEALRHDAEKHFINGKPGGKHYWGQNRIP